MLHAKRKKKTFGFNLQETPPSCGHTVLLPLQLHCNRVNIKRCAIKKSNIHSFHTIYCVFIPFLISVEHRKTDLRRVDEALRLQPNRFSVNVHLKHRFWRKLQCCFFFFQVFAVAAHCHPVVAVYMSFSFPLCACYIIKPDSINVCVKPQIHSRNEHTWRLVLV